MKIMYMAAGLLLAVVFCSCAAYVTTNDGMVYEALDDSEKARLVAIARKSLEDSLRKKMITSIEFNDAMKLAPEIKINYRGDKFGTAVVTWMTRGRRLEFRFDEDLTEDIIVKTSFSTSYIAPSERGVQPDKSIPGR